MNRSAVNQLDFLDVLAAPSSTIGMSGGSESATALGQAGNTAPAALRAPNFDGYLTALTSKRAGRINARSIPEEEYQALLSERQSLLDKKLSKTISRSEDIRLRYVRWSLDRIEDARYGDGLDKIEDAVERYEKFLGDLKSLQDQIAANLPRKRGIK